MDNWFLRINGRGNAWPVPIGQVHPFYSHSGEHEYENASFSLMRFSNELKTREHLEYELMIDAGHGSIPFLLNSYNRIPDALFITHPHFDHILGIDWIAQSYYRFNNKQRYPLYATENCWQTILKTIPHLSELIDFHPFLQIPQKLYLLRFHHLYLNILPYKVVQVINVLMTMQYKKLQTYQRLLLPIREFQSEYFP